MNIISFIKNIFRNEPVIKVAATPPVFDIKTKAKRKQSKKRAFGSVSATFKHRMKHMQVGQTKTFQIPALPDLSASRYASIISSWCVTNWGKGSAVTKRKGDAIIVKRIS